MDLPVRTSRVNPPPHTRTHTPMKERGITFFSKEEEEEWAALLIQNSGSDSKGYQSVAQSRPEDIFNLSSES